MKKKPLKNLCEKKHDFWNEKPTKPPSPREAPEPNKHNKSQQDTHKPSTQTQQ